MMTDTASLDAAQEYQTAAGGIEKKKDFERTVSETVQEKLGFQCGRVFCETYFNEDAKQDVASIIRQIIDVYDNRLAPYGMDDRIHRQEARKKLKAITVKVGYPMNGPRTIETWYWNPRTRAVSTSTISWKSLRHPRITPLRPDTTRWTGMNGA